MNHVFILYLIFFRARYGVVGCCGIGNKGSGHTGSLDGCLKDCLG